MKNLYIVFVDQFTCTFHRNSWSLVFYNRMPLCLDQGRHNVFFSGVVCTGLRETLHRLTYNMNVQYCARDCTDFHTTWLYRIAREIAQTYIQHDFTGLRERLYRLSYNMTVQDCARNCAVDLHTTWMYRIAREIAQTFKQHGCTGLHKNAIKKSWTRVMEISHMILHFIYI